ncbi:hypothetical protein DWF00_04570 [Bosea caraganae]|uniref:Uncharacterized protein n=1 Tax=Bosea caraganae TaxID=2763117 RepID=A0A370KZM5_9HYPH|nr:hypothetical protein [Bosea caraganae]RDJ20445.1 hypothetical protein DWE98_24280 [Bosea caraganae]RDJ29960.1 hypothetical protein DWF00_04570 [Bosea caraganae]
MSWPKISPDTGSFWSDQGAQDPVIFKFPERVFIDKGVAFNGAFADVNMVGQSPLAMALHSWAPRDASLYASSGKGAMAIVGHTQTSDRTGWPALPTYTPAAIGVSGFSINDVTTGTLGQSWGLYGDAVRMPGAGFTVGAEITCANLGDNSALTPYNVKTGGANSGVTLWLASGSGLDAVGYPGPVNDVAAGLVFLSSFADDSARMGRGIVFDRSSIRGTDGATGAGTAIAFAKGHAIEWFNSSGSATSFVIGQATQAANAVGIQLDDNGLNVTDRTGGVGLRVAPGANLANHFLIQPSAAGSVPFIAVEGSDASVDFQIKPKGPAGLLQLGYYSGIATNPAGFTADRYIYIRQADGVALAIPCRLAGW